MKLRKPNSQKPPNVSSNFMTTLRHIIILFLTCLLIVSCGRHDEKSLTKDNVTSQDSASTVIINDTSLFVFSSPDIADSFELTKEELMEANEAYFKCIADNKKHLRPAKEYKRQYVPKINSSGQKEIFVNCFCTDFGLDWRKKIITVQDGGNCFFNFRINLKTKMYYNLSINGDA